MSTRAVIARAVNETKATFKGSYHHWDGYPSGLGAQLFELYNGHFNKDLQAMLRVLIDEHPAWSTINGADWSLAPGFASIEERTSDKPHRPECYCHGERSETNKHINQKNSVAMGCEYAYVFAKDKPTMYVLSSYNSGDVKMIGMFDCGDPKAIWKCIAEVDLEGSEPQWDKMTE